MIGTLFKNEWRAVVRDGRGRWVLVLGAALTLIATWLSASTHARQDSAQEAAMTAARTAWSERTGDSPHSRAHYGDFVFRPNGPLANLDPGLQAVTGRVIYTEAHRQNSDVHKPQQESASLLRFVRLDPATMLQIVAPLALVLIGFGVLSSERESGRLRLLWIQGARPSSLLFAKAFALWTIGALLCGLVVAGHLAFTEDAQAGRVLGFLGVHLALLWVVAAVITCVSARAKNSGTAAALLLGLWMLGAIVMPRLAAMSIGAADPLPGRDAFQAAMQDDREQGLDGHNPRDERRQELEQQVFAEYGVESRNELPVNLGGLIMQADEDYGAQVWDKHFGELETHYLRQDQTLGLLATLNPLLVADRLSMAIAGTGLASHLDFLRQTEDYRRDLVRKLNEEDAFGVTRGDDGRLTRNTSRYFYEGFESFNYQPIEFGEVTRLRMIEFAALFGWLIAATGLLVFSARRLERRGIA